MWRRYKTIRQVVREVVRGKKSVHARILRPKNSWYPRKFLHSKKGLEKSDGRVRARKVDVEVRSMDQGYQADIRGGTG